MHKSFLHTLSFLTLLLCSFSLQAQPELVKDINPGGGWAEFEYLFHIGDNFYFKANGDAGREIWKSDGTPDGTELLLDINPGFVSSNTSNFVELNGTWYFSADNGVAGSELWKTDGTATGTVIVKDIHPGFPGADISEMVNINDLLYFQATDGTGGFELFVSDGTAAGTSMLADINPGASSSSPEFFTLMNGNIYFAASDGTNGKELFRTDGTAAGTQLVADVYTGAMSSFPTNITKVGNYIYFTADDGLTGSEIYKSDGTTIGTIQQGDINPGISPSLAGQLTEVGNYLFLIANDGVNGVELWRSDATSATPDLQMIELFAGAFSATPSNFIKLNDDLLFNANDGINGFELWKANAVDGSVNLVKNISVGFNSSFPVMLDVLNDEVIFSAKDSAIGIELWKTDGTEAGTVLLGDLNPTATDILSDSNPILPFSQDGILYFTAQDNTNGWQLWRTDGTVSATQRLTDIPHDTIFNNTYKPYTVNALNNTIVNFVGLGDPFGEELWKYSLNPIAITSATTNSPLACANDSNGTIEVVVDGGIGDESCFTYEWSDPTITGLTATDLSAGEYMLTVTDCVGFTATTTVTIEAPDDLGLTTVLDSDANCFGFSDGIATASTTGGSTPYSYLWDNGEMTATASSLNAGTHEVTVTDGNDCTSSTTVVVGQPEELFATATAGPTICSGANDGQASATAEGGVGSYTYEWDNGELSVDATALTGGEHTVTVTDSNGCTSVATVTVNASDAIELSFNSQDATCIDIGNGTATVTPTGGSGSGFEYIWSNGSTTETISNLAIGNYVVTVTDSNGCTNAGSVDVGGPVATTTALSPISCFGESDGQAEVVISGSSATYTYLWDNGETSALATMLSAGLHEVTISDGAVCSFVETVMIAGVDEFMVSIPASTSPTCPGESDGTITITPTGGNLPYLFTWSTGEVNDTGVLSGLVGDVEYCVTITEANGCDEIVDCIFLVEPPIIDNTFSDVFGTACSNTCDGQSTAIASGGTVGSGMYTYTWSSGETGSGMSGHTATMLCPGENFVTITDGICSVVSSVTISAPDALSLEASPTDVSCFGGTDGFILFVIEGGTPPYTIDGDTDGLSAGTYSIIGTDANDCIIVSEDIVVNEPEELTATATSTLSTGMNDGTATAEPIGGTAPYTYNWNTSPMQTTQTATGLPGGDYECVITDANGCTVTVGVMVDVEVAVNDLDALLSFEVSPNPTQTILQASIELKDAKDAKLNLFDAVGRKIVSKAISNLQSDKINFDVSQLEQGMYWLRLSTDEGSATRRVMILR